jgi:DNA polymerase-3 subunit alpha (Gram-positive type)
MEAGKAFFDVFCDLQLNEDTRELFSTVIVKRVTTNREKSSIRIYILNQYLIHRKYGKWSQP